MSEFYIAHHGVLGMKWGIRRYQPYRNGEKKGKEIGEAAKHKVDRSTTGDGEMTYSIKDSSGKILSTVKKYDFGMKDFNWELLGDID